MTMEPEKVYDKSFSSQRIIHQIAARVLTRSLKPEVVPEAKIQEWIQKLKDIVGQPQEVDYFRYYDIV